MKKTNKKYNKEYYIKNKEKLLEYQKKYRIKKLLAPDITNINQFLIKKL
jgi:hypothetical protein